MTEKEEVKNLVTLTNNITQELTEAYDMLNVLYEIVDGNRKLEPLLKFVHNNVKLALNNTDKCRELITTD